MSSKGIRIRVKVGERNKDVELEPNDKVSRIRELAFPEEVRRGQQIRLFYAGKELNSNDTVSSVKLTTGCVTHATIRAAAPSSTGRNDGPPSGSSRAAKGSGVWLALATGGVLCMLWVAQSQYPNFFTAPASTLLVGLTAGHLFLTYKLLIRTGPAGGAASS